MEHGIIITGDNGRKEHLTAAQGILLQSFSAPAPAPKLYKVEIDGSDGDKDYTGVFGEVKYKNRPVTATLNISKNLNHSEQLEFHSKLLTLWQGENVKLFYWGTPDRYYYGRLTIGDIKNGVFSISLDAEPYAYIEQRKVYTVSASNVQQTLTVSNRGKTIMPTITVTGEAKILINGNSFALSAGTHKIINIQFAKASNTVVTYSGSGTITFEFQERVL